MSDRVNIKISSVSHEAIKSEQRPDETLDETIRRVFEVEPQGVNVEDLSAFLPEMLRDRAKELVEFYKDIADFSLKAERDDKQGYDHIRFISPESDLTIAKITFDERWINTHYRNRKGNMTKISALPEGTENDVSLNLNIQDEWEEILEENRKKVQGAYRKWGKERKMDD